jgi:phosphonate utilization associated putative membrane protein
MTLTWPVVAAVLFGALLHASWNALVKSSEDKQLDTAVMRMVGAVLAFPLLFVVGLPAPASWPFVAASVVIHVAYYATLTSAYQHGELGLTYPLMRGTAPLLVALTAATTVGEHMSPIAWAGVIGISGGVLLLGLAPQALSSRRAVAFALANAFVIALYTTVDAIGIRKSGAPLPYVLLLFVFNGWPFAIAVFTRRGRERVWPYVQKRWPQAAAGASASLASYGIALWAMTLAPVATVAALRVTSVLFAALMGTWILKEAFTAQRAAGTMAIAVGVMALRLG